NSCLCNIICLFYWETERRRAPHCLAPGIMDGSCHCSSRCCLHPTCGFASRQLDRFVDTFIQVFIIFVLMINFLSTYHRLYTLINLAVFSGYILALFAIFSYITGNFTFQGKQSTGRVAGLVAGMFGNPNDLAISLNLLLPLSVALALLNRGRKRTL